MKPFHKYLVVGLIVAVMLAIALSQFVPAAEPDISISEPKTFFRGNSRVDIILFVFPLGESIYRVSADTRWDDFDSVETWKRGQGLPRHIVKKIDSGMWGVFKFRMGTAPAEPPSYYCNEPKNHPLIRIQVDYSDKDDIPYRKQFAFRGHCVIYSATHSLLVWYPVKSKPLPRKAK